MRKSPHGNRHFLQHRCIACDETRQLTKRKITMWHFNATLFFLFSFGNCYVQKSAIASIDASRNSVLRTDGCCCSRPHAELEKRLLQGENAGPFARRQHAPKEMLTAEQLKHFRSGPTSSIATSLQQLIIEKASQLSVYFLLCSLSSETTRSLLRTI